MGAVNDELIHSVLRKCLKLWISLWLGDGWHQLACKLRIDNTRTLAHTNTDTHARTHTHKMHNCDKYYLLSPRHLSPTYFPTRSCHYYCPCEQTLTWCLSASLPCMQMPVHVFLCQEMLACPSCMLELTERCDLLSKYLLLYQQGGSWFPPLLSPSLWARKLPSLEVRDNFFFSFDAPWPATAFDDCVVF